MNVLGKSKKLYIKNLYSIEKSKFLTVNRYNNEVLLFKKNQILKTNLIGVERKNFIISQKRLIIDDKYYNINKSPIALSEYLEKPSVGLKDYIEKEMKNELIFITKEKEKSFLENKSIQFNLPKKTYEKYLEKGMLGNAEKIFFEDVEIFFISTIYDRINTLNLFKLLNYINPDMIQVQIKPERIIKNIESFYQKENLFDNLIREAWEIQPSLELKERNFKLLLDNNIFITSKSRKEEILDKQKAFLDLGMYDPDRLSNDAISMISLWGEENKKKLLIADSPDSLLVEKISNSNSLVFIREIYKNSLLQFPNNPDYEPRTILGTAINIYPDIFLNLSDIFISNCINKICQMPKEKKPRKLVCFLGYGQSKSIPNYLKYNVNRSDIVKFFDVSKRFESVVYGEDNLEILVEKWVLLFMILKNAGLKSNLKISSEDPQVDRLIRKYAREEFIITGFNSENFLINRMKHLFDELVQEKKIVALEYLTEGHKIKKKLFMRKIYYDPLLNSQLS